MTDKRRRKPGAGRPRKPTSLKKLAGTIQKCRTNTSEPKPTCEVPAQEFKLGKHGKKAWDLLGKILGPDGMRVCTKADVFALYLFCQAWERYMEGCEVLKKEGSEYTTTSTQGEEVYKARPLAKQLGEERDYLTTMMARMGLTPADRSRVNAIMETDGRTAEGKVIAMGKKRRAV